MQHLFIYGSLGPGGPNEHVMAGIGGRWQAASLKGYLVEAGWGASMGYPALVIDPDGKEIRGHVFSSDRLADHWQFLDEFEGAEYERTSVAVTLDTGTAIEADVYALRRG